mmetsp:Transcript_33072/g.79127  ORF Transcript_33072/g.79127 Transcript_33072/m.79127 type:complete len:229 (-) Transcript_33072:69-755(-)
MGTAEVAGLVFLIPGCFRPLGDSNRGDHTGRLGESAGAPWRGYLSACRCPARVLQLLHQLPDVGLLAARLRPSALRPVGQVPPCTLCSGRQRPLGGTKSQRARGSGQRWDGGSHGKDHAAHRCGQCLRELLPAHLDICLAVLHHREPELRIPPDLCGNQEARHGRVFLGQELATSLRWPGNLCAAHGGPSEQGLWPLPRGAPGGGPRASGSRFGLPPLLRTELGDTPL